MNSLFSHCRIQIDGFSYALPGEVMELLGKGAWIVDLREEFETLIKSFGVEKILYLPYSELDKKWQTLSADLPLILADSAGVHTKEAMDFLKLKGYENIAGLAGGFADWTKDGFPVKAGKYEPLNGPCPCMIKPKERKNENK
jgi:hydroxyacylglutathione hydrolase